MSFVVTFYRPPFPSLPVSLLLSLQRNHPSPQTETSASPFFLPTKGDTCLPAAIFTPSSSPISFTFTANVNMFRSVNVVRHFPQPLKWTHRNRWGATLWLASWRQKLSRTSTKLIKRGKGLTWQTP